MPSFVISRRIWGRFPIWFHNLQKCICPVSSLENYLRAAKNDSHKRPFLITCCTNPESPRFKRGGFTQNCSQNLFLALYSSHEFREPKSQCFTGQPQNRLCPRFRFDARLKLRLPAPTFEEVILGTKCARPRSSAADRCEVECRQKIWRLAKRRAMSRIIPSALASLS